MPGKPPDLDVHGQPVSGQRPPDLPAETSAVASAPSGPDWSIAPTFGGMVGGLGGFLLGGPIGAIAGAGLGGMVGEGARQQLGGPKNRPSTVQDALSGLTGNMVGQATIEAIPQVAGRLLTKAAPHVMDMGLKRTAADRLQFPGAPQRLVDEGIIPRGQNVQKALSATEGKIMTDARAFDAQRPRVAGYLGPATEQVPLGATPIHPTGDLRGPGVVLQPSTAPPGRGAPPTMVDPERIADSALSSAFREGRVGGLGTSAGPEAIELSELRNQYLAQNQRPLSLEETIAQKRAYQARAKYSARPNAPTVTNNALNFNGGVAAANRAEAIRLHPPLEADLSKEQDLIGALTAQENAAAKATPLSTVGTLKSLAGLRNPTAMGAAAIATDRAGRVLQSPYTTAALRAAILALLNGNK